MVIRAPRKIYAIYIIFKAPFLHGNAYQVTKTC